LDRNMRDSFFYYLKELEELGYQNKFEILNAMDFGIAQKRERIFAVSCLEDNVFQFENLEKQQAPSIKEILEKDVSEKYLVHQPS
ncbi:DNA cytosine methyltransferase, partial [Streptococcus pyogenes]